MKVDRRFSQVVRTIWSHPKFRKLSGPKPNAKTLVLRLLVAPEMTGVPGIFKAWDAALAADLGWPLPAFRKCLAEVIDAGWAVYDDETGVFWIPNALDQEANQPANPNVVRSWRTPLAELPESDLKARAVERLHEWATEKGEPWAKALEEALGRRTPMASPNPSGKAQPKPLVDPSPIQEHEKEKEQEKEQEKEETRGRAGRGPASFQEPPRAPGAPPRPRKDLTFTRFAFAEWFPTQAWLDWWSENDLTDAEVDATYCAIRDKLGGTHDVEWWDTRVLRFFEVTIEHRRKGARAPTGAEPKPFDPAERARRLRAEQDALDAAEYARAGGAP